MTILTVSAAALAAGIDRRTLQSAIRSGRISATVDAAGRRGVDVAELLRVYGPLSGSPQALPQGQGAVLPQAAPVASIHAELVEVLRQQATGAATRSATPSGPVAGDPAADAVGGRTAGPPRLGGEAAPCAR